MYRNIENQLLSWKNKKRRKPLIIYGARQIGKTYSIQEFGKKYFDKVLYVNFETNKKLVKDFEEEISAEFLIRRMEIYFEEKIIPDRTLIFFDEIQANERALASLKYFYEEKPEYYVIAAGSLLGVVLNREKYSFPVGKVEQLSMYSMGIDEFMKALKQDMLLEEIKSCYEEKRKMDTVLHEKAMELYREYLLTGGMPEAVLVYSENRNLQDAIEIQHEILHAYVADMAKYATASETTRILACFDSIPAQLAKENRKFQYKIVAKEGRAATYSEAIDWLLASGIVTRCNNVDNGVHPLEIYKKPSSFKLYMGDVGLLSAKSGIVPYDVISGSTMPFIGAIAENYVANSLERKGYQLYYWTSGGEAEVDFVIEKDGMVIPVEVKAGEHTRSKSLSVFKGRYKETEECIRISAKNFGWENNICSIPLYAAWLI